VEEISDFSKIISETFPKKGGDLSKNVVFFNKMPEIYSHLSEKLG
jgi:hypothetical protein